jgi:D-lactate dehydrogenase
MRCLVFSCKSYDQTFLNEIQNHQHELVFHASPLNESTVSLAATFPAVCLFVNDVANKAVLQQLAAHGTRTIALRCAGFNNVDLIAAEQLGITVVRVPAYSPYATAEHAVGLMMVLNRKIHRAYNRVREGNFSLDGLLGFDMHGKTVGVVGTGKIGEIACRILTGFGCTVLACDPFVNPAVVNLGVSYKSFSDLLTSCDIITLHAPLTPQTKHLIDSNSISKLKHGMMLINTSRGALVDTPAVIEGLKSGHIGAVGLDVYEEEADLFFEDLSSSVIQDDVFSRLLTFPNVVITGHQAFFTAEAMMAIARITLYNLTCVESGKPCENQVRAGQP